MNEADGKIIEIMDILRRKAEFHRTNTDDPHNIGAACLVALTEIADAIAEAYKLPPDE